MQDSIREAGQRGKGPDICGREGAHVNRQTRLLNARTDNFFARNGGLAN
jgi:hypothetical protein